MRTLPVKYSSGPLPDACEPLFLISILFTLPKSYGRSNVLIARRSSIARYPSAQKIYSSISTADASREPFGLLL
jgi:hypothetical protein